MRRLVEEIFNLAPLALGAITLGLSSCSDALLEGVLTAPPELRLEDPEAPSEEARVIYRVVIDEDAKEWEITGGKSSLVALNPAGGAKEMQALRLDPDEKVCRLKVPVALEESTFNFAVVHMEVTGTARVSLQLSRDGEAKYALGGRQVQTTPSTDSAQFDMMAAVRRRESYNELELTFRHEANRPMRLLGVDFLWSPLETRLPLLSRGSEQSTGAFEVNGEYRACVSLTERHPITTSFVAPAAGDLVFSYGLPENLRIPESKLFLEYELREDGEGQLSQGVVEIDTRPKKDAWHEVRIPMSGHGGSDLTATFRLDDKRDSGCAIALALPRFDVKMSAPPRVLLITSDTHRGDHLGASNRASGVKTPFLDELASRGVFFEDCFSTTNITLPSHAAIMTGLSPRDTGVLGNSTALSSAAQTLAEHYRDAGYHTLSVISSVHLAHDNSGMGQGFDRGIATRKTKLGATEAVAHLASLLEGSESSPVFAWLHLFEAHAPYLPPDELKYEYYDESLDPTSPNGDPIPDHARAIWDRSVEDRWFIQSQYMAEVTHLDQVLSRFAAPLNLEDWIVAFTSDHGESFGAHDVYWRHIGLYPDTVSVPLIIAWPGGPTGARVSREVMNLDVGRTLLDLSGLGGAAFPGENLVLDLEGGASKPRYQLGAFGHYASVEQGGWFLTLNIRGGVVPGRAEHQVELYDLSSDYECANDLVDEEFDRARQMRASLINWLESADASALAIGQGQMDVATLNAIQALGYAADPNASQGGGQLYVPNPANPWCARFK